MKKKMEILSDMEMLQIDENGSRLTPISAVNAVNDAANTIEGLYQSLATAKTHLQCKDK